MTIQTRTVDYSHQGVELQGFMAWDDAYDGPRPCVVICHAFRGRESFECDRARDIAALGYVGFALDLYGTGVLAETTEEASAKMQPFLEDRPMLQSRLETSVEVAADQAEVDGSQMAAMGYCFGGLCALDLARTNAPLAGVVSFHGLLVPPGNTGGVQVTSKVLVETRLGRSHGATGAGRGLRGGDDRRRGRLAAARARRHPARLHQSRCQ